MRRLKRNRKAALELSITAIVVLIIAVTVLGLAIGFIKKQFGAGTELFTQEYSNIKQQMEDDMRSSGELLTFSFSGEVDVGKPQDAYVGIRNTAQNTGPGDSVCFAIQMKCVQAFNPENSCYNGENNIAVGGYDMDGMDFVSRIESDRNWFKTFLGTTDIQDFDATVLPVVWLVRGVQPDIYQMELSVYKSPINEDCSATGYDWSGAELYDSKRFTVTIK